jgi:CRISPR-associated protein Csx17
MTTSEIVLPGTGTVPLGAYLKALGVFRLVGEQADPDACACWRGERLVMRSLLTEESLVRFLTGAYRPTPIVAPWNKGSGFWAEDNREGLSAILASRNPRLRAYRATITACQSLIGADELPAEPPAGRAKARLIAVLRANLSDEACRWLDSALALTGDGPRYPPLLGTGGNDGRLDFSRHFMQRVGVAVLGDRRKSAEALRSSLFGWPFPGVEKGTVGQFSPGTAGGVNAGAGFEMGSRVNSWDFILTIEGALAFAAAAVRRHARDRKSALAFPFATRSSGVGSGAITVSDEAEARGEFWAPLWSRPIRLEEMLSLMSEGRAVVGVSAAPDALSFARAVAQLGVARGIEAFQRHGFLMRAGRAYFATSLGRVRVRENQRAALISELDEGDWLSRARRALRDEGAAASFKSAGRELEESLFRLAGDGSAEAVQAALVALGSFLLPLGRLSTGARLRRVVAPPPLLSSEWARAAADGSHEFALAEALASLDARAEGFRLPFRCHLAPLEWSGRREAWSDGAGAPALSVWTGRDLIRDMISVLDRRLMEAQRRDFVDREKRPQLPLRGWRAAPLAAVAAFLAGHTDDQRIARLAAGLAWARSRTEPFSVAAREHVLPFGYAAAKPLFAPQGTDWPANALSPRHLLRLVRLIRVGRSREAAALVRGLARSAARPTPFRDAAPARDPNRLAAALLFPITPHTHARLVSRAYADLTEQPEETHAA